MEIKLIVGAKYAVSTDSVCRVTYMRDGQEREYTTAYAGQQGYFVAQSSVAYADDENADITLFTDAPSVLVLLRGGGNIPAGYTRLEYLEATGEQYINTGVPLSSEIDVLVDFAPVFDGVTQVLFGTIRHDLGTNRGTYAQTMPTAGRIVIWRHTRRMEHGGFSQARHRIESTGTSLVLDGTVKSTYTEEPWEYTQPCYLGAGINQVGVVQKPMVGKLYGFALTQSGSKKLNLIPALDPTGAPCMFDTVSRTPFYNAGTGDFVTPTTGASTYSLRGRRVLPDWGKLTENGLRRLYHAPAGYTGELYDYALETGYKPIVEEPAPDVGYWVPVWHDREDCIELEWVETEPPVDELSSIE